MPETYPDDTTLLALNQDDVTGVEYIPTGQSPYVTAYRRMLYRLLRATERANDLRVYPIGGRLVGIRAGRCFVGDQPHNVAEPSPIELAADTTSHLYVNVSGVIITSTTGLPADRATFIPLAEVVTDSSDVTSITDLRGEAMLQAQSAALAGINATADEINQALDGIDSNVTAANLSTLTDGSSSTADAMHRHLSTGQDVAGPAMVSNVNLSMDAAATVGFEFSLPLVMPGSTRLQLDRTTGFLQQTYQGESYHLLGSQAMQWTHDGALSSTITDELVGSIPVSGEIVEVILSTRLNTQSSDTADGLSLDASINGNTLTTTPASLTATDGSGFRSTDQGDGAAASIVTDGTEQVSRGDLLAIDLSYTANGTVSQQPTDIAVLVVIKADQPI